MNSLYTALNAYPKQFHFTNDMIDAFERTKEALAKATGFCHQNSQAPLDLTNDASGTAKGSVLEQFNNGMYQPLSFFSRQLRSPERNYSTYDRELLAVYLSVRHFRHILEDRKFTIYTDQKPLTFSFTETCNPISSRQQRQLSFISKYTTDIRHIAGNENHVADTLSRTEINSTTRDASGIDYIALARDQDTDKAIANWDPKISSLKLDKITIATDGTTLLCHISAGRHRPIVPEVWRKRIFNIMHGLSPLSIRNTQKLISEKFVWPNLRKDVAEWAKICNPCQTSKIPTHTKAHLVDFDVTTHRFSDINIDIVGPLPRSNGCTYLLTIVDRSTWWLEAIPMIYSLTITCANAFVSNWISRFGIPTHITSDRRPQFTSYLWATISKIFGCQLHHTTAYHPQANGIVERFHRHLKTLLRTRLKGNNWVEELPWALLGIRTAVKEDLSCSSAELVYGYPLSVPGDFVTQTKRDEQPSELFYRLRHKISTFKPISTSKNEYCFKYHIPASLSKNQQVFIRSKVQKSALQRPYEGPFKVLKRNTKTFEIDVGGRTELVSIDRLKPAHIDNGSATETATKQPRG